MNLRMRRRLERCGRFMSENNAADWKQNLQKHFSASSFTTDCVFCQKINVTPAVFQYPVVT